MGKPGQEGREGDFRLQVCQRRAQAVVDAAAEGQRGCLGPVEA